MQCVQYLVYGVVQFVVGFDGVFQDFGFDVLVIGVVVGCDLEFEDVGVGFFDDGLWFDGVVQ